MRSKWPQSAAHALQLSKLILFTRKLTMTLKVLTTSLCISVVALLTSCVKLQVNADGVVDDTVSAGKSLYRTIKHKKDGTEERFYSHSVELLPDADERQIGVQCLDYLAQTIETASEKEPQILEQSTEIINAESGSKLKCSVRAVL